MVHVKEWVFTLLEEHRGIIVLLFCLPLSFVFDCFLKVYFCIRQFSDRRDHESKVGEIQAKIKYWNSLPHSDKKLLCTARPNWLSLSTTFFQKDKCHKIAISLYDILSLDEKKLSVKVEPLVTVGDITKYLLPKGYILSVHLEIAEATLGGLAMGVGMTTHSHKVGLYQETVISYDVLLSDGSLVHVTKDNMYSDLYNALPWSHGTIGFLVALELEIIPAKPFVHLNYIPMRGQKRYCTLLRELAGANSKDKTTPDVLEAIIYSKDEAVLLAGWFSNTNDRLTVNHVTKWYNPWFYKHVETFLKKGNFEELIPLDDYLMRHNRSIFWVVESMLPFGNNVVFRLFFGWLLPPKVAFLKFTTTPGIRKLTFTKQVFQDIVLPMSSLEQQIDLSEELFDLYPLLVYPCRVYDRGTGSGQVPRPNPDSLCPGADYALYNDLGIYGVPGLVRRKLKYNSTEAMRKMEAFTRRVGGFSFLYADIFMTRDEFEQMFDLKLYEEVRRKYSAVGAFPHLYHKVKPEIDLRSKFKDVITALKDCYKEFDDGSITIDLCLEEVMDEGKSKKCEKAKYKQCRNIYVCTAKKLGLLDAEGKLIPKGLHKYRCRVDDKEEFDKVYKVCKKVKGTGADAVINALQCIVKTSAKARKKAEEVRPHLKKYL